jgi:hypothetical protein
LNPLLRTSLVVLAVIAIGIQLVPVSRTNPPVETEVPAPEEVRAILKRACYDCHSHETRWPWYAHVAPVSWLVAYDVHEAREHLNFSTWNRYDAEEQRDLLGEAWEEVKERHMPLWYYVPLHREARLERADRRALREWTNAAAAAVAQEEGS